MKSFDRCALPNAHWLCRSRASDGSAQTALIP